MDVEYFIRHCRENNLEGVNDCLSRGIDVNSKEDYYGRTVLIGACEYGNSAIVSRLVQVLGLDINYQDEYGVSSNSGKAQIQPSYLVRYPLVL